MKRAVAAGRRRTLGCAAALAVAVAIAGCAGLGKPEEEAAGPPVISRVSGVAMYLQRIGLPPGANVTAQLVDASSISLAKPVLGEQRLTNVPQLPVRFQIDFDLKKIKPEGTYLVQVVVDDGKRTLLVNRGLYPVITRGYPTEVEVMVDEPAQ